MRVDNGFYFIPSPNTWPGGTAPTTTKILGVSTDAFGDTIAIAYLQPESQQMAERESRKPEFG